MLVSHDRIGLDGRQQGGFFAQKTAQRRIQKASRGGERGAGGGNGLIDHDGLGPHRLEQLSQCNPLQCQHHPVRGAAVEQAGERRDAGLVAKGLVGHVASGCPRCRRQGRHMPLQGLGQSLSGKHLADRAGRSAHLGRQRRPMGWTVRPDGLRARIERRPPGDGCLSRGAWTHT